MNFVSKLTGWFNRRGGKGDVQKSDLQQNMERALAMKQEAGSQSNIPEHQTGHRGGIESPQVNQTDTGVGTEATYTRNLKRSRVARSGDT
jgi:hypothetical protein